MMTTMIYYDDILRLGYSTKLYIVDGNRAYETDYHSSHIDVYSYNYIAHCLSHIHVYLYHVMKTTYIKKC